MRSYTFNLECPRCGGEVDHNDGVRQAPDRAEGRATCRRCLSVFQISVCLTPLDTQPRPGWENRARQRAGMAL